MRTDERHRFEKICDRREVRVTTTFVIKFSATQELELGSVEGVAINLPVVELDRADGLLGREEVPTLIAQAQVTHEVAMLREPARDGRTCDLTAAFGFDASRGVFERVA